MKASTLWTVAASVLLSAPLLSASSAPTLYECLVESEGQAEQLNQHFDVFTHSWGVGDQVDVRARDNDETVALNALLPCSLKQQQIQFQDSEYSERRKREAVDPFFTAFQRYDVLIEKLEEFSSKYPALTTYIPSIAVTHEQRNVPAIIITDKSVPDSQKKMIWWNGMQHAREWISPATVMYLAKELLTKSKDSRIANYLKKFQFVITPMNNPDGYEFTHTHDRYWRKNRRDNGNPNPRAIGVDLNRNWDDGNWGVYGAATNVHSETYQGPFAFSEPETNGTANFIASFPNRYSGIDFHSYGQLILRNWGYTQVDSPNEAILKKLGDGIRDAIFEKSKEEYTSEKAVGLYPASGCADDWQSMKLGMAGFTIELRSQSSYNIPPSEIVEVGEEIWNGMLFYLDFLIKNSKIPAQVPDQVLPVRPFKAPSAVTRVTVLSATTVQVQTVGNQTSSSAGLSTVLTSSSSNQSTVITSTLNSLTSTTKTSANTSSKSATTTGSIVAANNASVPTPTFKPSGCVNCTAGGLSVFSILAIVLIVFIAVIASVCFCKCRSVERLKYNSLKEDGWAGLKDYDSQSDLELNERV
ncbi:hypothetical protein HDU79_003590 [Rhizoclosmatium sp. JEL0117]|nr:hypothetical protein HDU79_003590 [Rhizoclosmatium sp. JEL0117]